MKRLLEFYKGRAVSQLCPARGNTPWAPSAHPPAFGTLACYRDKCA
jgi:hypothetical protein